MNYRPNRFSMFANMPAVTKNLLIINILIFIITLIFNAQNVYLIGELGLFYFGSPLFEPYQIISHMFMHGGFAHIFFNMFALWMFGSVLEKMWGPKRFLFYYFFTGLGAAFLHLAVNHFQIINLQAQMTQEQIDLVFEKGYQALNENKNFVDPLMSKLNLSLFIPTVGASGAIYGLLLAFGILFPNTELMIIFFPVPIKAKYMVIILIAVGIFLGIQQYSWDNIAHFAHLGGMLFGFILIKYWQKSSNRFY